MDFLGRPIGLPFSLPKPKVVSSNLAQLNFLFSQNNKNNTQAAIFASN